MSAGIYDETSFDFINTTGYKNGFFGCLADPLACLLTYCCGGIAVGWAAGTLKGAPFDIGSCCCGVGAYRLRRDVQKKYGITETEAATMCATSLCGLCAVVQDLSEMRARGDFAGLKTVQPAGTTPMTTPAAAPAPAPVAAAPVAAAAPAPEPTPAPAAAEAPAAATDAPAS